jgi:uncharacterized protein (DUF58 family)
MPIPYVRQYNEDREVTAWFLLDLSPSIDFGTVEKLKRNLLIEFVALFARLLTRHGNRVGAIFYSGETSRVIPAHNGKLQVLHLINSLLGEPRLASSPRTDLGILFESARRLIRRRSLIFVVSDFISVPGWGRSLKLLTQLHEIVAIRLYDPRETELPDIGVVIMQDAETGEQLYVDTSDRGFRQRFIEAARRRETELSSIFRLAGVDSLDLSTADDMVKKIVGFAALRKQRKLVARSIAKTSVSG